MITLYADFLNPSSCLDTKVTLATELISITLSVVNSLHFSKQLFINNSPLFESLLLRCTTPPGQSGETLLTRWTRTLHVRRGWIGKYQQWRATNNFSLWNSKGRDQLLLPRLPRPYSKRSPSNSGSPHERWSNGVPNSFKNGTGY
jgi:hypothetical protein